MMRAREENKPTKDLKAETYFPKKLHNVESVIKKRVEIDREINKRRKVRNSNLDKDVQIYAKPPPQPQHPPQQQRTESSPLRPETATSAQNQP